MLPHCPALLSPFKYMMMLVLGLRGFALAKKFKAKILVDYIIHHWLPSTRVNYISRSTFLTYLKWAPILISTCQCRVMLLNCAGSLVRVLKTGFHYFIFHRKPLHGAGLGLANMTELLALQHSSFVAKLPPILNNVICIQLLLLYGEVQNVLKLRNWQTLPAA